MADGRPLGVIVEPEWRSVVLPNAEARLLYAIQDGLYALEAETEFDLLQHFDTADDLIEAKTDRLAVPIGARSSHSHSQTAVRHPRALHWPAPSHTLTERECLPPPPLQRVHLYAERGRRSSERAGDDLPRAGRS